MIAKTIGTLSAVAVLAAFGLVRDTPAADKDLEVASSIVNAVPRRWASRSSRWLDIPPAVQATN